MTMSNMSANQAAWISEAHSLLTVGPAPTPKPKPGELVIKARAVAVNPVDWKIQQYGIFIKTYPFILGEDVAGTVEEVGEGVTRFSKGQRVIAHLISLKSGNASESAFQLYTVATESLTAAIPDSMSFEQATVLPLAVSTAAVGLYFPDYLGLPVPSLNPQPTGKTILVWGGASSVGATAIQLASASGLKVVTTASPHNHEFVRRLGASVVFDYKSPAVVEDVLNKLRGTEVAGVYDAISEASSFEPLSAIAKGLNGIKVASVLPCDRSSEGFRPESVVAYDISSPHYETIRQAVWGNFIPKALASGQLQPKPDSVVVGHGLHKIQLGMDVHKSGVSAKKVIVTL